MCGVDPDYTMLVGPRGELERLEEEWGEVTEDLVKLDLPRPQIHSLEDLGHHYTDPLCPAVGVLSHEGRLGNRLAGLLQTRLVLASARGGAGARIICEPGYQLATSSWMGPNAGPDVELDYDRIDQAAASIPRGSGSAIAVIDTGGRFGSAPIMDFVGGSISQMMEDDPNGHGMAVAALIEALRPGAYVIPIRVANAAGLAESRDLLLALAFAMWPRAYDVINVSLTTQIGGACPTALGATLEHVLTLCRRDGGGDMVSIVAAAGNSSSGQTLGYPAALSGVEVAVGRLGRCHC